MRNTIIDPSDFDRIIRASDPDERALWILSSETGFRIGDLLRIRQWQVPPSARSYNRRRDTLRARSHRSQNGAQTKRQADRSGGRCDAMGVEQLPRATPIQVSVPGTASVGCCCSARREEGRTPSSEHSTPTLCRSSQARGTARQGIHRAQSPQDLRKAEICGDGLVVGCSE